MSDRESVITAEVFTTAESIPVDFSRVAPLTGPIFVIGTHPGDVLSIKILKIAPKGIGTLVVWPSNARYDFLDKAYRDLFPEGHLKHFDFSDRVSSRVITLRSDVSIPITPILGMLGTAPASGDFKTGPPREFGGNMTIRGLGKGATIHLPVQLEGGLVSLGDGHAVQGDGELCITGVETAMDVDLEIMVHKDVPINEPHVETEDLYIFTAFGLTLEEAADKAMCYSIGWLSQ